MLYDPQQYAKRQLVARWSRSSEFCSDLDRYNLREMPYCFHFKHEKNEMASVAFEPFSGYRLGMCGPTPVRAECEMTFHCDLPLLFFVLVLDGSYHVDFGDSRDYSVDLRENDFMVALCGNTVMHSLLKKQDNHCNICLALDSDRVASYFGTQVSDSLIRALRGQREEGRAPYPVFTKAASPELQSLGRMIVRSGKTDCLSVANLRVASLGMFSKMLQLVCCEKDAKKRIIYDDDMSTVTRIKNMIELDVIENSDAREVCAKVGVSLGRANRLFRELYGVTLSRFIHNCKMEHAHALMQARGCNVSECAFEVGYSNIGHFIAAFKKQYNCTPGDILHGKR